MKTLANYKARYRKAKTCETQSKIMNGAMNNLSHEEKEAFIKWQVNWMQEH